MGFPGNWSVWRTFPIGYKKDFPLAPAVSDAAAVASCPGHVYDAQKHTLAGGGFGDSA